MEGDFAKLLELALQQGIWAVLYIYLFFKMLKDNASREEKYQSIIERLSGKIAIGIEDINNRLDDIFHNSVMNDKAARSDQVSK